MPFADRTPTPDLAVLIGKLVAAIGRRGRQTIAVAAVSLALGTAVTTSAAAQANLTANEGYLVVSPNAGPPRTPLTVLGGGCAAGALLEVSFDNQVIGTTVADPSGGFDTTVATPAAAVAGTRTITVSGPGCLEYASFEIQVGLVQNSFSAVTTRNVGPWEVAAGLAVLAAVFVVTIRRRRNVHETDRG